MGRQHAPAEPRGEPRQAISVPPRGVEGRNDCHPFHNLAASITGMNVCGIAPVVRIDYWRTTALTSGSICVMPAADPFLSVSNEEAIKRLKIRFPKAVTQGDPSIQRDTLEILTAFGDGGRQPGQFYAVHSIATDSKGNVFTTETYRGQRVQKFHFRGLAPVTKKDQGVVWPSSGKS